MEESGEHPSSPGAAIQALLVDLEARLAEVAVRPGSTGVTTVVAPLRLTPLTPDNAPLEHFLAEQAVYADSHIDTAHRTVAALRTLAARQAAANRGRLTGLRAG